MIRVTIEIVPYGDETKKRHLGTVEIARTTLFQDPEVYTVWGYAEDGELLMQTTTYPHSYRAGVLSLVRKALTVLHLARWAKK